MQRSDIAIDEIKSKLLVAFVENDNETFARERNANVRTMNTFYGRLMLLSIARNNCNTNQRNVRAQCVRFKNNFEHQPRFLRMKFLQKISKFDLKWLKSFKCLIEFRFD